MNTEIQIPNVADQIRDRIKSQFAALIPDDQWDALIENGRNGLINGVPNRYGNGTWKEKPLAALVREEWVKQARVRIAELVKARVEAMGDEDIQRLIVDLAPEAIQAAGRALIAGAINGVAQDIGWKLASELRNQP